MAHSMKLEIISPEKTLFQGLVNNLSLPSKMGHISILLDHAPLVSSLEAGTVSFTDVTYNKIKVKIKGGILKVEKNQLMILTVN